MNFRRLLSKSSVRSSSSSDNNISPSEDLKRLLNEIEVLKQTIESLRISVESRDAAIGTLAREKEKLYVELKSTQRTNRNLHQQLIDERDIHSKEKEYLLEEIKRTTSNCNNFSLNTKQERVRSYDVQSCSSLNEALKAKDEVICNICTKYLKIKASKRLLQKKMYSLQQQSQKICEKVILLLHENRETLNNLLRKLMKTSSAVPSCTNYYKLLKINSNLHYENTQLKVCLSLKDFYEKVDKDFTDSSTRTNNTRNEENSNDRPSKSKQKIHKLHSLYANLYKVNKLKEIMKFNSIHQVYSPYFRRKICYKSDPCITRPFIS